MYIICYMQKENKDINKIDLKNNKNNAYILS